MQFVGINTGLREMLEPLVPHVGAIEGELHALNAILGRIHRAVTRRR